MTYEEIENKAKKTDGLAGMTVNERLFVSGLMDEFDTCKSFDKKKAKHILRCLLCNEESISKII